MVSIEGNVLIGPDGILLNQLILPIRVELVQDPFQLLVMICMTGSEYFGVELYKVLTW